MPAEFQFGAYRLTSGGELFKGTTRIRLQQHPLTVLEMLAEAEGGMVSRDQIRERLWPNGTVVEWDHSINSAVNKLRSALSDTAERPKYIETLARRGYRLRQPVQWLNRNPAQAPGDPPLAMQLTGAKLSHYRILELIGGGGMGLVFKALDLHLDRNVAIKVLPEDIAGDADSLARFEREAKAASALEHPNICTVYEFGHEGGRQFLAMQLLEGATVKDRIAAGEPVAAEEALGITAQIAAALEAAHESGIIHRDIKPANIFITRNGQVKVLDFGVAKLAHSNCRTDNKSVTNSAERTTSSGLTRTGVSPGTVAYMAPEQLRGESADHRADIYATGLVLLEMLTGKSHPRQVATFMYPGASEQILRKALEDDPGQRYSTAKEFRHALEKAAQRTAPKRRVTRQHLQLTAALLIAMLATATWWFSIHSGNRSEPPEPPRHIAALTSLPGRNTHLAISPDGTHVVFSGTTDDGSQSLYVTDAESDRPARLTNAAAVDASPVWSPDGKSIAFLRTAGKLTACYVLPVTGGTERKLADVPSGGLRWEHMLDWSPDGQHLAIVHVIDGRRKIVLLRPDSGAEDGEVTFPGSPYVSSPRFSRDGTSLAAIAGPMFLTADVWIAPLHGGAARRITQEGVFLQSLAWEPKGKGIIFASKRSGPFSLWWVSTNGGTPAAYLQTGFATVNPAFSKDGSRLVFGRTTWDTNIWRTPGPANRDRSVPVRITDSTRDDVMPNVSPDGRRLAFISNRSGGFEVWVSDADGKNAVRLTHFGGPEVTSPKWSADGASITFSVYQKNKQQTFMVPREGGVPHEVATRDSDSADNVYLLYQKGTAVWRKDKKSGSEHVLADKVGKGLWAPSGEGICYMSVHDGSYSLMYTDGRKESLLARLGTWPEVYGPQSMAVSPDRKWVYYQRVDQLNSDVMIGDTGR